MEFFEYYPLKLSRLPALAWFILTHILIKILNTPTTIETDRLRLRRPAAKDIPNIVEYANNPNVNRWTLNMPYPYEEKDAITWISMAIDGYEDQSHFIFAICPVPGDELIGGIGLRINRRFNHGELGFWIGEPFWNKGYMTEAAGRILKFGFGQRGLHKIYATHFLENTASAKVMMKNGMIKEGELVDHVRKDNRYLTLIQYRITKEEFLEKD